MKLPCWFYCPQRRRRYDWADSQISRECKKKRQKREPWCWDPGMKDIEESCSFWWERSGPRLPKDTVCLSWSKISLVKDIKIAKLPRVIQVIISFLAPTWRQSVQSVRFSADIALSCQTYKSCFPHFPTIDSSTETNSLIVYHLSPLT